MDKFTTLSMISLISKSEKNSLDTVIILNIISIINNLPQLRSYEGMVEDRCDILYILVSFNSWLVTCFHKKRMSGLFGGKGGEEGRLLIADCLGKNRP